MGQFLLALILVALGSVVIGATLFPTIGWWCGPLSFIWGCVVTEIMQ